MKNNIKQFLRIHDWGEWQIIQQDHLEEMRGAYVPYILQKRQCKWSGKWQINLSASKYSLHYVSHK